MKFRKTYKVGTLLLAAIFTLISLGAFPVQATPSAQSVVQNPLIWADVPDPDVIRVGNVYYMSSTTMHYNPGVPIMKSTDLVNWQIVNYAYSTLADTDKTALRNGQNEYGDGSWASTLRYKNGKYYVAFMSYTTGKTYIYQTTNIETGPWTVSTLNGGYHDSSLLFDDDGRVYLTYGSGDIRIIELTADATAIKSGGLNKILIPNAGAVAGSGGLAAEGSHFQKINGKYYVFLISWPSGSVRTQIVYRSDTVDGTYQGQVMLRNSGTGIAQGGLVDTPTGQWYAMLFQDHGAVGRIPFLIPVTWSNNWPVVGNPQSTGITANVSYNLTASDEFSSSTLGLRWQWNHNPNNPFWSLTSRPGYMRLTTGSLSSSILSAQNTLTQRTYGPESTGNVAVEIGNMKDGDYAGLTAFQFYYGFVGVKMSGTTKSIVMVRGSTNNPNQASTPVEVASVPLNQTRVYLRVYTDYRSQTDKASFYYSLDGNTWTAIGTTLQMAYTLPHFVGYRFGLFNFATKSTGGSVDFDFFRVGSGNMGGPTATPAVPTNTPVPSGNGGPYGGTAAALPGTVQAENYNTGGEGVAYHDTDTANQGGQYRTSEGVDVETTTDTGGGYDVGYTAAGEWMKYTVNVTTAGTYTLTFRVGSAVAGGGFHLEVDGNNVTGAITMPNTGGWQTYTNVTKTGVNLTAGQHVLRLVIDASNGNFNWFSVSSGTAPTNAPAPIPTNTPVAVPTNTPAVVPTNTPVVIPTNTSVAPTPTVSGGTTCSPVTATITAPFSFDGAGTFCWRINNIPGYINSWNVNSLTVNGVNFTNLYATPGQLPAKASDGYWYIAYNSAVSWGHFEAK